MSRFPTLGVVVVDFVTRFPHKFWISTWGRDEQYPEGYRYKLLSVRTEPDGLMELVVLIEQRSGEKEEMTRLDVSPSALDRTAATFTDGLMEEYGLEFEELNLSGAKTEEQFQKKVLAAGWEQWLFQ